MEVAVQILAADHAVAEDGIESPSWICAPGPEVAEAVLDLAREAEVSHVGIVAEDVAEGDGDVAAPHPRHLPAIVRRPRHLLLVVEVGHGTFPVRRVEEPIGQHIHALSDEQDEGAPLPDGGVKRVGCVLAGASRSLDGVEVEAHRVHGSRARTFFQ